MSDERRDYEGIRRRANRAQERLTATLEQSRIATARDKHTNQRRAMRDASEMRLGRERHGSRSTERACELGDERQVGCSRTRSRPRARSGDSATFVLEESAVR